MPPHAMSWQADCRECRVTPSSATGTLIQATFKLSVSSSKAQLDISYIGYQSQTVAVQPGKNMRITLQEDSKQLDEVVVVGYGTQSKKTLTGAVSMVNMGDVEMNTVPNVSRALAGKAAGFRVNQVSAQPGGEAKFRIRGEASTGAGNEPLFVIDGFPVSSTSNLSSGNGFYESGNIDNVLESLNPDDIESISVLKDAASTAIYGARAGHGVVLITTKRGKSQKPRVTYSGMGSVQVARSNYKMLDTRISRADEPTREVLRSTHRSQMPDAEKIATIKAVYDRLDIPRLTEQQISLRFERALGILDTLSVEKSRTERMREYALSLMGRKN